MTDAEELKLIENIRSGKLSERELINLYKNNVSVIGTSAIIQEIKLKMRLDFPRAAKRIFGAKESEASDSPPNPRTP
jgi:hypothetical protein